MQISSSDQSVRNDTIQESKELNSQSLTTQAKKGEQLVSTMPALKKAFNILGDDIIKLSVENDALRIQLVDYDQKWLEESKAKLLKDNNDEKKANLFMSKMKKQMKNKYK